MTAAPEETSHSREGDANPRGGSRRVRRAVRPPRRAATDSDDGTAAPPEDHRNNGEATSGADEADVHEAPDLRASSYEALYDDLVREVFDTSAASEGLADPPSWEGDVDVDAMVGAMLRRLRHGANTDDGESAPDAPAPENDGEPWGPRYPREASNVGGAWSVACWCLLQVVLAVEAVMTLGGSLAASWRPSGADASRGGGTDPAATERPAGSASCVPQRLRGILYGPSSAAAAAQLGATMGVGVGAYIVSVHATVGLGRNRERAPWWAWSGLDWSLETFDTCVHVFVFAFPAMVAFSHVLARVVGVRRLATPQTLNRSLLAHVLFICAGYAGFVAISSVYVRWAGFDENISLVELVMPSEGDAGQDVTIAASKVCNATLNVTSTNVIGEAYNEDPNDGSAGKIWGFTVQNVVDVVARAIAWLTETMVGAPGYIFTAFAGVTKWLATGGAVLYWAVCIFPLWVFWTYDSIKMYAMFHETQAHLCLLSENRSVQFKMLAYWTISAIQWPCPRTVFFLQMLVAAQFWFIAGLLTLKQYKILRARQATAWTSLIGGVKDAWKQLWAECRMQFLGFDDDGRHYREMKKVANREYVVAALINTAVFISTCVDPEQTGPGLQKLPRWPWDPPLAFYGAASRAIPLTRRALSAAFDEGGVVKRMGPAMVHLVWHGFLACVAGSGWIYAWLQARRFARVLDPTLHAKCCIVCMEQPKAVVMVPCGHQLCRTCSPKVDKCPQCREGIKEWVTVHD